MTSVVKDLPQAHLAIVGDGNARQELEKFVHAHALQKNITFKGWIENAKITSQYYQTTAFVIPSIWPENLPTVCIEALATGRPVIGSRTGGIPELVQDKKTGYIVPLNDPAKLAAAILKLLNQKNLSEWSERASASMRQFDTATFISNIEKIYKEAVSENSRR
jgi:glycosyltransferase involved in cell wall biosynthesis